MSILTVLLGLLTGIASGFFGIGGAVILIPSLVYLFKFSQQYAQGTAIGALVLPVGLLAAIKYYQAGNLNIKLALLISLGFFLGGFIGAYMANLVPNIVLKRLFGVLLLFVSMYMLLGK